MIYIIYRIIDKIISFPRNTKFFFQRLFRGYGDNDLWSLDYFILKKIRKPFKAYVKYQKEYGHSYPMGLGPKREIDIRKKKLQEDIGFERWILILEKIEKAMDLCWEDYKGTDEWFDKSAEEQAKDGKIITEGFELFGKYFRNFWD